MTNSHTQFIKFDCIYTTQNLMYIVKYKVDFLFELIKNRKNYVLIALCSHIAFEKTEVTFNYFWVVYW